MQAAAQRYCVSQQGLRSGRRAEERPQSLKRCVVINHKTTKFESNSQRHLGRYIRYYRCYQSQKYKIWKQFTTAIGRCRCCLVLLSITKPQNLKAIHNWCYYLRLSVKVVINHKITKFESNLQRFKKSTFFISSCYQSQNYKIWKQFTTTQFNNLLNL